eukprot:Gb_01645 [translate_table: standard]
MQTPIHILPYVPRHLENGNFSINKGHKGHYSYNITISAPYQTFYKMSHIGYWPGLLIYLPLKVAFTFNASIESPRHSVYSSFSFRSVTPFSSPLLLDATSTVNTLLFCSLVGEALNSPLLFLHR